MIARVIVCSVLCSAVGQAFAHDSKLHSTKAEADAHLSETAAKGLPLPLHLGGHFALTDQYGKTRTEADPDGKLQLVYFGYASCKEICSVALPQMAEVEQGLAARGLPLTPVLITVDPARDTVATLGPAMATYGAHFVGLTGDEQALRAAYKAFSVDSSLVFDDPQYGPVYAHGSFFYLLDGKGAFLTVIPPILATNRVIDLIAGYAPQG